MNIIYIPQGEATKQVNTVCIEVYLDYANKRFTISSARRINCVQVILCNSTVDLLKTDKRPMQCFSTRLGEYCFLPDRFMYSARSK